MGDINADKAVNIAREFFKHGFAPFEIVDTILQNGNWLVKGRVSVYGVHSNRIVVIDSKTGNIVSCQ